MTITIGLSSEEEIQLRERALRHGQDLAGYVRQLIARDLLVKGDADRALAPFRRQVEESGLSEDDLDDFFEDVREDVWRERQASSGSAEGQ
jgi:hypothetical protein